MASIVFDGISRLRPIYALKSVYRNGPVGERKESSAEHTFSALMLADYLLNTYDFNLDKMKAMSLILYHDLVEIETGDIPLNLDEKRQNKQQEEAEGIKRLGKKLPKQYGERVISSFNEFENYKTREAKFAKMIDGLDALVHFLDYKSAWKGWTETMVRKYYEKRFSEFPVTEGLFEDIIIYIKENGYI
jgi:putative hydrolase of HD superfamily